MANRIKILLSTLFLLSLLLGMVQPVPVLADSLSITWIDPHVIYNDVPNTVTITGTGFAAGAQVRIGGSDINTAEDLVTNYMGTTELKVNIPVDFTPGMYTIYVINDISDPAGTSVYKAAGLTVKTPGLLARPQMSIKTYSTSASYGIIYGQDFKVTVRLQNSGGSRAYGVQVTFSASELLMLGNGGVVSKDKINAGDAIDIAQTMTAATYFYGQTSTPVEMTVSYSDDKGTQYSDKFTLNLAVYNTYSGGTSATATPTGVHLSQLIISSYKTDVELLQPGLQFKLDLTINNMGDLPAKSVTMIVGGGSSSSGGGTPGPGGVSGSSGDFSNFAPVGTSNVQSLGDIQPGTSLTASQQLIVNVNTSPGAYPMKITLSYTDSHGAQINDEQVVTLLVFSLPSVEIGFYQPVTELFTYQPNLLPLQVVNMGRKTAILGNMTVSSTAGFMENGQAFVGTLEPGGYFTLDSMLTPEMAGEVEVVVTIDYTDDFNTPRTITKTLIVNVVEMPVDPSIDPNNPDFNSGGIPIEQPETVWQKIVRFILGLFGLDSSAPSGGQPYPVEPTSPGLKPVPMPGGKG